MSEVSSPATFRELTPTTFLERAAGVYAERPAVVDSDAEFTYAELYARAQRMAGLIASRVSPGDRVCVLAPNTHMLLEAHYGIPMAGAILVALNTRLAPLEIAYILDHCSASAVLVDHEYVGLLNAALRHSTNQPAVIDSMSYEHQLRSAAPHHVEVANERSLLSLNYTSGTTGRPKGVQYHHRGAYLQALAMAFHARLEPGSRYLWTLPMFHTNGWCFPWAVTAAGGTHRCLRRVDPGEIWAALTREHITHLCAAPTVLTMIADHPNAQPLAEPVKVFTGGAPPWPTLLTRMAALGFYIEHLYGLTETFGPAVICEPRPEWSSLPAAEHTRLIARQGVPNIISESVRVVDPRGDDVAADGKSVGEIVLRGNNVMLGYYRDDEATAQAIVEGAWLRTGDLGVKHPDTYIEVLDRAKDVIVSGGENISSVEIENAMTEHPDVAAAAVVAAPDDFWGEIPVAFATLRPGADLDEEALVLFLRQQLARFKTPRHIVFGPIPTTSTGKTRKTALRDAAIKLVAESTNLTGK